MECYVSESLHPSAPHHLPGFAPGDTDILMVVVGIVLIGAVLMVGNLYIQKFRSRRPGSTRNSDACKPPYPAGIFTVRAASTLPPHRHIR